MVGVFVVFVVFDAFGLFRTCGCVFVWLSVCLFGWLIVCVCECPFEGSAKRKHMKMKYSSVRGFAFGVTASLHRVLIKSWDAQPFCL